MQKFTLTLTENEVHILQIGLSEAAISSRREAEHLEKHNKSGINTNSIKSKQTHVDDCNKLWSKLYHQTHIY